MLDYDQALLSETVSVLMKDFHSLMRMICAMKNLCLSHSTSTIASNQRALGEGGGSQSPTKSTGLSTNFLCFLRL